MNGARGFSLLELVMVIVIVAIGAVAIGSGLLRASRSLALNEDVQRTSQVAYECAEHILSLARPPRGHHDAVPAALNSTICNGLAAAGFTRDVDIEVMPTGGSSLCLATWNCKSVKITVTKGSAVANVNFMVVRY